MARSIRKTPEERRIAREVEAACNKHAQGRQFDIFDLSKISMAGHAAALAGKSIDEAVLAAAKQYNKLPEAV